ncbi:MAG: hypothetical protein AB1938_21085 [Myxococcota bacterium]
MRDMTDEQALAEARRRWGDTGHVRVLSPRQRERTGRLARYRFMVGNHAPGPLCTVQGQGNSWREAFDDAVARS